MTHDLSVPKGDRDTDDDTDILPVCQHCKKIDTDRVLVGIIQGYGESTPETGRGFYLCAHCWNMAKRLLGV